jgi:hypothetical protein
MKISIVLVLALLAVSCDEPRPTRYRASGAQNAELPPPPHEEVGPEVTEAGKVLEIAFRLGSSTTTNAQTPGYNKTIAKSAWDDPLGMHSKTVEVPSVNTAVTTRVEDQFAVVFECQHGKFLIEDLGRESRAGNLWKKLKQGDNVKILYKEVYYVVPAEGTKKLRRFEFVDADAVKE